MNRLHGFFMLRLLVSLVNSTVQDVAKRYSNGLESLRKQEGKRLEQTLAAEAYGAVIRNDVGAAQTRGAVNRRGAVRTPGIPKRLSEKSVLGVARLQTPCPALPSIAVSQWIRLLRAPGAGRFHSGFGLRVIF